MQRKTLLAITHVNWEEEEAVIYTRDDGECTAQKPFRHVKFQKERFRPPINIMTSIIIESIWEWLLYYLILTHTKIKSLGENPRKIFTLQNCFYATILTLTLFAPQAMAKDKITRNFAFELLREDLQINNNWLWTAKSYVPCDLIRSAEIY